MFVVEFAGRTIVTRKIIVQVRYRTVMNLAVNFVCNYGMKKEFGAVMYNVCLPFTPILFVR